MKKYIPVVCLITVLGFYLVLNSNNYMNVGNAGLTSVKKQVYTHYESVIKNLSGEDAYGKKVSVPAKLPKVLIVNFWASWCTPCLEEFPSLVNFTKKYKSKDVMVLGINTDDKENLKDVRKANRKHSLNFDSILDQSGDILDKFKINRIPVTIVYINGKVHEVSNGAKDFEAEEFTSLVKKSIE
tara:strand:- start:88116 stop:88667 length:552 start_codon:yes stop_codon:yes gene_type:complete